VGGLQDNAVDPSRVLLLCASVQAGRIGSAALMQLSEHDMEIYNISAVSVLLA
jgi:hypothetical protein